MQKSVLSILMLIAICFLNCGTSIQTLPEPMQDNNLVIGAIIFDIDGYQENFTTLYRNIEVAIVGRYIKDGMIQNFGRWATTDENGYFFIPNVPDGEYAIKGFRTYVIGLSELTIENQLIDPMYNYYELDDENTISFGGELFDTRSDRRIVNFKHNYFKLHRSKIVNFTRFDKVDDLKLSMGDVLNRKPVPVYFIEKYEGSSWENYLIMQLK